MMSTSQSPIQFDFGKNWEAFSKTALNRDRIRQAELDFQKLFEGIPLKDRSFLDIGFGQGLSLLSAALAGAICLGIDINPRCIQVLEDNRRNFFPEIAGDRISTFQGSILDPESIQKLRSHRFAKDGAFDIVHSWGALHHSGAMFRAIQNSAALVGQGGHLLLAIYQAHWSSPLWKQIKYFYNRSPSFARPLWIWLFYPIIYLAKWIATGKNPLQKNRGMDFYYDIVDWVGGHPYEYATQTEITDYLKKLGFSLVRFHPPITPIGCMEFVFQKELQ
jgi:SAM-dependent methyltransferase